MTKSITAILLLLLFFMACKKEENTEPYYMSATYKNRHWRTDSVSAILNASTLNINGSDGALSAILQLNYNGKGAYPINIVVQDVNPWYWDSHNFAAMGEEGYYTIIDPVTITGSVEIQSISSKVVEGTFQLTYLYDDQHQESNFNVTDGRFRSPIE